jgi:hypothetical protein
LTGKGLSGQMQPEKTTMNTTFSNVTIRNMKNKETEHHQKNTTILQELTIKKWKYVNYPTRNSKLFS